MDNAGQIPIIVLFRQEAENQSAILTSGLLTLERDASAELLDALMRAAHSLKGAARIVGIDAGVRVAHAMEDCFTAAQKGKITLGSDAGDVLFKAVDLFGRIAQTPESDLDKWKGACRAEVDEMVEMLKAVSQGREIQIKTTPPASQAASDGAPTAATPASASVPPPPAPQPRADAIPGSAATQDRVLRVTASNLNRLLGLAGESLVESRWLRHHAEALQRLKRQQWKLSRMIEDLREDLAGASVGDRVAIRISEAQQQAVACVQSVSDRHAEIEQFSRRSSTLAYSLYQHALASRMRPFRDALQPFPRLVRDLARSLGKEVRIELAGESTLVDRDVMERIESPLDHLVRNSIDHGIEMPMERLLAGKTSEGCLRIEARHSAGFLLVMVQDDGRGVDLKNLRMRVLDRKLTTLDVVEKLSDEELLQFLFLPGFSMREQVTEISGRGVGLDIVLTASKAMGGNVRVFTTQGRGTRFQMQLPLTLSVLRSLIVEVAGEPYAFPLARVQTALRVSRKDVETLEGRDHIPYNGRRVGLVSAHQVLGRGGIPPGDSMPVVVIGDDNHQFGVAVDRFIGERELVVQPLDPRLGKIKDISSAAIMPDGSPLLILDVDDVLRSVELLITGGRVSQIHSGTVAATQHRKRILVVDDSLTVRELERKILGNRGYEVEVAVDGMDGWNAVRTQQYDLVISDVDMPRMDGIELVKMMKHDVHLKSLPVMIVSYKDRPEDRQRGLDAGADYYLTKGGFHDETLIEAVVDLIGQAEAQ